MTMDILPVHFYSPSLDLVMLVIAVVADVFLAFTVYMSNPRSATNRTFAFLTASTMGWLVAAYLARSPQLATHALILHRFGIFFAAPMSMSFLLLAHTMPAEKIQLKRLTYWALLVSTAVMMALNISPYAFTGMMTTGDTSSLQPGPGLIPFAILSTLFSVLTIYLLVRKYRNSVENVHRQFGLVLSGIAIMLFLVITTILFPILYFSSVRFLPFTPLYALIFLGMTAYAITKYRLFNIKVLLAQVLTLSLGFVLFARLFAEQTADARVIDGLILCTVATFGFFLVRSVKKEVTQRERIERLAEELKDTNCKQEILIHFIGHEVKGYLTKDEGTFAELIDGEYGPLPERMKEVVNRALAESRHGATSVTSILKAANLKKGTVAFEKAPFDLKTLVEEVVEKMRPAADVKGLKLSLQVGEGDFTMVGDRTEIGEHVLRNLIDNAISYTPVGAVEVSLERRESKLEVRVKDTGVGLTDDDKRILFTEGGHGKDSIKVNVHSTGYGLFIVRKIAEAHGGTVRADSEGEGAGSTFTVEFPARKE